MRTPPAGPAGGHDPVGAEARRGTRGGAVGLAGAAVGGLGGFVLTTVIVRAYGPGGAGALFTAIGVITILGAVCCLGADTGLMFAVPRRPRREAARLLPVAVLPPLVAAVLVAAVGVAAAGAPAPALLGPGVSTTLLRGAFAGVPVLVVATVLLAAVRATRPVGAYVAVQSGLVAAGRPVLVGGAVLLGGGVVAGFAGWLLPLVVAAAVAAVLLVRPLGHGAGGTLRPGSADWRQFWGFALPRAASAAIDAGGMWVGVLLTAALAGQAQAGLFAAAGRYVLAGLLVMQGLRVAAGPQVSRLLGAGRRAAAAEVYRRTTLWIVVVSWPAYLLLAVFAPAFLQLFGAPFRAGAAPLAVLSVAMTVNVGVGLAQTVLLMSGGSRRHLLATATGLALTVTSGLLLIPAYGATGAAIAWSLGIVAENTLAAVFARRALGYPMLTGTLLRASALTVAATGLAAAAGLLTGGRGPAGLAVALGMLTAGMLAALGDRRVRAAIRKVASALRGGAPRQATPPGAPGGGNQEETR